MLLQYISKQLIYKKINKYFSQTILSKMCNLNKLFN
jgi:hypothetical protein